MLERGAERQIHRENRRSYHGAALAAEEDAECASTAPPCDQLLEQSAG